MNKHAQKCKGRQTHQLSIDKNYQNYIFCNKYLLIKENKPSKVTNFLHIFLKP